MRPRSWSEREALIGVSAAIAAREDEALSRAFRIAERAATTEDVDEVILQAHLFVGYPLALEAFRTWREISPGRGSSSTEDAAGWRSRGEAVCAVIYGSAYPKLLSTVDQLHPELGRLMLEVGYGRIIGRPTLDLATRELCIAALLAVWNTPRQLHSHLRGALNAGATPEEIEMTLQAACRLLVPSRIEKVAEVWAQVNRST
jgi:4-carboxymuconolactone decarboxylase